MSNSSNVLFARGVIARLRMWPVLRIAIQEGWGGDTTTSKSKRTWLASSIVDAFEETDPTPDDQYIEMMLLQVMADEFGAVLEDNSAEQVAVDIVKLWEETREEKDGFVKKFEETAAKLSGKKIDVTVGAADEGKEDEEWMSTDEESGSDEDDDDGDEAPKLMQSEPPKPKEEPEVDEDGFTMVKKKGKR